MNRGSSLLDRLGRQFFSSTQQLQRVVLWTGAVLIVALAGFAIYYYQDRYYSSQSSTSAQQASVAAAEQAVRADPENADKRLQLAQAYMTYRRFDDAIRQAQQVQQVDPNNLGADFVLGVTYANNGKPDLAVAPLQKFVDSRKSEDMAALDPQLQSALYYLGDSFLQLGQPENAIAPLEMTVRQVGTDADATYKLGMAYAGVKRYDDALRAFQVATAFVPNFAEAYQGMGEVYAAQNQPVGVEYASGMLAFSHKDYANAYSILLQVNQAAPSFAPGFTGMGLTCEAQANLACALSSYQVAAKLDPQNLTAAQGVARVQTEMQK